MKYAVIVLVACYLLVWGCGPDNTKKNEEQKTQATHSKVEPAPTPAQVVAPPAPAPVPEKTAVAAADKAKEQPAAAEKAAPPSPASVPPVQEQAVEPQKMTMPGDMAAKHAPPVPVEEEQLVTLPCGHVVPRNQLPPDAPCLQAAPVPCPMMHGRQQGPADEVVVLPCGRPCFRHPALPPGHPEIDHPDFRRQPEPLSESDEEPSEDLAGAMQRMVEATNDMVVVTRQLVVATQEMVRATQDAAYQLQQPQIAPPVMDKVEEPTKDDATATMREAVGATQKALEALNQVLPKVLEPRP